MPVTYTSLIRSVESKNLRSLMHQLENGFDVNEKDGRKNTALMIASKLGQFPMVEALLDYGADVQAYNSQAMTALMLAATLPIAVLLLNAGASERDIPRMRKNRLAKWVNFYVDLVTAYKVDFHELSTKEQWLTFCANLEDEDVETVLKLAREAGVSNFQTKDEACRKLAGKFEELFA